MFDTFYLQDKGRTLDVQSKAFACLLDNYHLGDFVDFDGPVATGITAYLERYKERWQDQSCPEEWIVLLLVDACFMDGYVAATEAEAKRVADVMVKLWASPERQADAFKRFAKAHDAQRTKLGHGLDHVSRLLSDYTEWRTKDPEKNNRFRFLLHDFDKETWDVALARTLSSIPEYAEHVPAEYLAQLAAEIEDSKRTQE